MPNIEAVNLISDWPEDARIMAGQIIKKYGEPQEATSSMLIWYNNGPWKRTIVYRDTLKHNLPFPHSDGIEQFIDHEVPIEKASEVAAFNGSVTLHFTRGEISACCHSEEANFLAINLANEIIRDKKNFEQARAFYIHSILAFHWGQSVPYMEGFQFPPETNTTDPDDYIIPSDQLPPAVKNRSY